MQKPHCDAVGEYGRYDWKEVSTLMRRCRWEPDLAREWGRCILYGGLERITSVSNLRTMTPAQFWERLRKIDPNRVSQVERNIF